MLAVYNDKALMEIAVQLMPLLRPTSPASFAQACNTAVSTAWASCLGIIIDVHEILTAEEADGVQQVAGDLIAVKVLLDQVLPVLSHVASLQTPDGAQAGQHGPGLDGTEPLGTGMGTTGAASAASGSGSPTSALVQAGNSTGRKLDLDINEAATAALSPRLSVEHPGSTSQHQSASISSSPTTEPVLSSTMEGAEGLTSVGSTLALLAAASRLVWRHCIVAERNEWATNPATPSTPTASITGGEQDSCRLVTALETCLSLSRGVFNNPSLWDVAKAKNPLLLIDSLWRTTLVGRGLSGDVYLFHLQQSAKLQQHCRVNWRVN
jgi:hypothetical protein